MAEETTRDSRREYRNCSIRRHSRFGAHAPGVRVAMPTIFGKLMLRRHLTGGEIYLGVLQIADRSNVLQVRCDTAPAAGSRLRHCLLILRSVALWRAPALLALQPERHFFFGG